MKSDELISRREFGFRTLFAPGAKLSRPMKGAEVRNYVRSEFDIMHEVRKYRKIDAYANAVVSDMQADSQIRYADLLNIEKLVLAVPVAKTMGGSRDEIRAYNDYVIRAVSAYPDRLMGQFTVNPLDPTGAFEEIKRCVDAGLIGMKLFNHAKINNQSVFPIIERFIHYKMMIHVHGESQIGVGGYRMKYDVKNNPAISVPEDFIETASRYPEAMFQYAHIGGGSDWEYACKSFINFPNIYVDTGGSNNEENMVDFAIRCLGENRVFFGCDGSFYQGVGKVLSADINDRQRRKLFFDNYNSILKKSGNGIN